MTLPLFLSHSHQQQFAQKSLTKNLSNKKSELFFRAAINSEKISFHTQSFEVVLLVHLLLDVEQQLRVPRVQAGDLVELLDLLREGVDLGVLDSGTQGLKNYDKI